MKRMILVAAMLLFVISVKSQNDNSGEQQSMKTMPVSYCMSYEEFKADNWQKADNVQLIMRSEAQVVFSVAAATNSRPETRRRTNCLRRMCLLSYMATPCMSI